MSLKLRPPAEVKAKLSRAEIYAESVLRAMEKNPGNCNLFNELVPHIGKNGLIVFGGEGGGSIDLATGYLKKLSDIHAPHCNQTILHEINIR